MTDLQSLVECNCAEVSINLKGTISATFQVILHPPIGAAVIVMCMGDEQHRSRLGVLGHSDGVAPFGEDGGIVVDVFYSDVDLSGAVNRRRVSVGLQDQQNERLRLVVQGLDAADKTRLGMYGKQSVRVSRRESVRN